MTVRSDHVVASSLTYAAGVAQTLATCPSGERWIVKDLAIWNNTGLITDIQLQLLTSTSLPLLEQLAVPIGAVLHYTGLFLVVRTTEALRLRSSQAGNVRVVCNGARLVV